jgi:hypothetical protein
MTWSSTISRSRELLNVLFSLLESSSSCRRRSLAPCPCLSLKQYTFKWDMGRLCLKASTTYMYSLGLTGLPAGVQHAESADSPQEPQLPASGLQLQPEACQNADHQGAKEVALRECVSPVPRDSAADKAGGGCQCPGRGFNTWQSLGRLYLRSGVLVWRVGVAVVLG